MQSKNFFTMQVLHRTQAGDMMKGKKWSEWKKATDVSSAMQEYLTALGNHQFKRDQTGHLLSRGKIRQVL
jgi:hypothetical protein